MNPKHLPQRTSLADQVAQLLRDGIGSGQWCNELPGENELSREYQVSRSTLRQALSQLIKEELIVPGGRRRHHRIVETGKVAKPVPKGEIIRVLTPKWGHLGSANSSILEHVSEYVSKNGYRLLYEQRHGVYSRNQLNELERLKTLPSTAAWIVFSAPEYMQRWFSSADIPCVIIGSKCEGVDIPSITIDYESSSRHVVGMFCSHGYREIYCLVSEQTSPTARNGVVALQKEADRLGANVKIINYIPEVKEIRRKLDLILTKRTAPIGFYVMNSEESLTVTGHLIASGLRVPGDAAVVSSWDEWCLHYSVPSIAHYRVDPSYVGKMCSNLLMRMLKDHSIRTDEVRVVPDFVSGESMGAAFES